ncbi:MAG: MFS transporter, partial [Clostridia bacterium]|nr:MFS transporter [Clostridia bacterium]
KKTILAGVLMLTAAFTAASFIKAGTPEIVMYALFALAGIGWATINVNSFPMVVELAKCGDVGKYTGFYYTASMSAQIVTPIFSGFLIGKLGWWVFFPYAAIFTGLAFVTMLFVRHGDARPEKQGALEALGGADD